MDSAGLQRLSEAVNSLLARPQIRADIARLKREIDSAAEAFVWTVIGESEFAGLVPAVVRSAWIFVLKRDTPSGAHYHPNSVQHMVMLEGRGTAEIAGREREMLPFATPGRLPQDVWYVIEKNTPHEFFPRASDMVVMSFHTCPAEELQEISRDSGELRYYETA